MNIKSGCDMRKLRMHRDMMKNVCKMAVFSIAMQYFFHPDAIFFSSRRINYPLARPH